MFFSLCVFLGFTRGGLVTHNLSSLPGLAFFFCNQLAYGRLVIMMMMPFIVLSETKHGLRPYTRPTSTPRRAAEMATLGS
jgi:hypothetical protein